jgi:DNA-directed RNA polymerase subunit M/transcription elongation factor TFIIS
MMTNPLKTQYPIFEVTLPSTQTKVSCRPWLVKEERILLAAKEAGRPNDIGLAMQQTMRNCVLDPDFKVEDLNTLDMEWLFLRVRAAGVGEDVKVDFVCNNEVDGKECGGEFQFTLRLAEARIENIQRNIDEVSLTDIYNVRFRYPLFSTLRSAVADEDEKTAENRKIKSVIEYIAPKNLDEKQIDFDSLSDEHVNEFIEGLTVSQMEVINKWIEELPEITLKTEAKCPKCGHVHEGDFDNLVNFF